MSEILNQFRDEKLPPSTVDISGAARAGRRRRRIRTGFAAGGVAVALAVAGAAAPTLLSAQPSPPPPIARPPTCDAAQPPPRSPSPTWEYFDPLTFEIDASGVTRYRLGITTTSTYYQQAFLSGDTASVDVMLYAAGGEPHSFTDQTLTLDPATGVPADPVNGAPAYWLPAPNSVALAWEWTPGAWAIVKPIGSLMPGQDPPSQDDLRTIARQVAQQVELGAGTPVTSPFSLPLPATPAEPASATPPECLYPALTVTFHGVDGREDVSAFHLGFDPLGQAAPTHGFGYVPYLWVNADAMAKVDGLPDGATEYPEDLRYPAYQVDQRPEEVRDWCLLVLDVSGFGIEIEPRGVSGAPAQRLAYAADVFRTITVYPDAATGHSAWGDPIAP